MRHLPRIQLAGSVLVFCCLPSLTPICAQQNHAHRGLNPPRLELPLPRPSQPVEGFRLLGGSWEVRRGELWVQAGPGPKLILENGQLHAGEVGVEVFLPDASGGNAGLLVKVSEPGVGADAFVGYEVALDAQNQVLRLGRYRHNFELIRDVPCTVPVGRWIGVGRAIRRGGLMSLCRFQVRRLTSFRNQISNRHSAGDHREHMFLVGYLDIQDEGTVKRNHVIQSLIEFILLADRCCSTSESLGDRDKIGIPLFDERALPLPDGLLMVDRP